MPDVQHAHNTDKQQPTPKKDHQPAADIEAPQISSADILRQMAAAPPDGGNNHPSLSAGTVKMLQRTAGNRYTNQLVQRKRHEPPVIDGFIGSFARTPSIQRTPANNEEKDPAEITDDDMQQMTEQAAHEDNHTDNEQGSDIEASDTAQLDPSSSIQRESYLSKGASGVGNAMDEKIRKPVANFNDKEASDMSGDNDAEKYAAFAGYKVGMVAMDTAAGPVIGLAWNHDNLIDQWNNYACMYGGGISGKIAVGVARASMITMQLASLLGWLALIGGVAGALGQPWGLKLMSATAPDALLLTKLYILMKGYLVAHSGWRVFTSFIKGEYNSDAMSAMLGDALDGGLAYGANKLSGGGSANSATSAAGQQAGRQAAGQTARGAAGDFAGDVAKGSGQELATWSAGEAGKDVGQPINEEDPCDVQKKPMPGENQQLIQTQPDAAQYDELITGLDDRIANVKKGQEQVKGRLDEGSKKTEQAESAGKQAIGKLTGLLNIPKKVIGSFKQLLGIFKGKIKLPSFKKLSKVKKLFKSFKKLFKKSKRPPKLIQRSLVQQHTSQTPIVQRVFKKAWKWIKKQIKKVVNKVISVVKKIIRAVKKVVKRVIRMVKSILKKVKRALSMGKQLMDKITGRKKKGQMNKAKSDEYDQVAGDVVKKMEEKKQQIAEEKDKKAS